MSEKSEKKAISVQILDQAFCFNSDSPPERIGRVAEAVNLALKELLSKNRTIPPYHAAILVALNMTERYYELIEKQNELKNRVSTKSKKILGILKDAGRGVS